MLIKPGAFHKLAFTFTSGRQQVNPNNPQFMYPGGLDPLSEAKVRAQATGKAYAGFTTPGGLRSRAPLPPEMPNADIPKGKRYDPAGPTSGPATPGPAPGGPAPAGPAPATDWNNILEAQGQKLGPQAKRRQQDLLKRMGLHKEFTDAAKANPNLKISDFLKSNPAKNTTQQSVRNVTAKGLRGVRAGGKAMSTMLGAAARRAPVPMAAAGLLAAGLGYKTLFGGGGGGGGGGGSRRRVTSYID